MKPTEEILAKCQCYAFCSLSGSEKGIIAGPSVQRSSVVKRQAPYDRILRRIGRFVGNVDVLDIGIVVELGSYWLRPIARHLERRC